MHRYRQRLQEEGLRPVQFWVPDTTDPAFLRSLRKELASLNRGQEADALAFMEHAADLADWQ